ncbi:hypothetical protein [Helicobacter acinonychis]|uniref:hypothetical protein n=1 Tax=Helicobacter acinonychis TaxID=212 RepID=UPI001F1DDFF1|nr:hypothetical protein [Helicobacter acinonychis]
MSLWSLIASVFYMRFGGKKLYVLSHTVSSFLNHFNQLGRSEFVIKDIGMQDI